MPETQSQEEFEHFHNDAVKNLKIEEGEIGTGALTTQFPES
jgi:hypothetical protein